MIFHDPPLAGILESLEEHNLEKHQNHGALGRP